jgi:transketolase
MTHRSGASHVASGLSVADILAVLYAKVLRVIPEEPNWGQRDRLILSKGHAAAALYSVLARTGFFDPSLLETFYLDGSMLAGHATTGKVPGVEHSTGSLGHGLSVGVGMAYGARIKHHTWRTFVVLSDGECDEGSTWEAAMFASHHRLGNVAAVVDYNHIQSLASTDSTLTLEPFSAKWAAFGWRVIEIDGHDHRQLLDALNVDSTFSQPSVVIANTTKGKGVDFMENSVLWHYRAPNTVEREAALDKLRSGRGEQ